MDQLEAMLDYESGELDDDGVVNLFQQLVNSGLAWRLQGSYGRMARALIEQGFITLPEPQLEEMRV